MNGLCQRVGLPRSTALLTVSTGLLVAACFWGVAGCSRNGLTPATPAEQTHAGDQPIGDEGNDGAAEATHSAPAGVSPSAAPDDTTTGAALTADGAEPAAARETQALTMMIDGQERTARLHIPGTLAPAAPRALVIGLHGAGGNGADFLERNGWRALADEAGFVVVAPDGLPPRLNRAARFVDNPRLWNTGQLDPNNPRTAIADAPFIEALITEVRRRVAIDERRIFMTGHSNGAGMTYRLAQEMNHRLAAIAPVMSFCWQEDPRLDYALPTLAIYGMEDPLVPFAGGTAQLPWGGSRTTPPVDDTLEKWARALACGGPRTVATNDDGVKLIEYPACRGPAVFRALIIEGHGHEWPGGRRSGIARRMVGPRRDVLDATRVIWDFFSEHPRR